ncbi:recombinase family protein [Mycobacterium avium]|nr:recombinase family protein [Mycobacterium avium]
MFGYTRVSTDEQVNGYGLDAQRDTIDSQANRRGWTVEHFADELSPA